MVFAAKLILEWLFQYAQNHDKDDPATKEALRYRTGRVLNILYLIQEELLNLPIL